MRVVDSGVAIAAALQWHDAHDVAVAELRSGPQIAAHALVEAYSVLTRLPGLHRVAAAVAAEFLDAAFPRAPLSLKPADHRSFVVHGTVRLAISGGAVYDALIAETVRRGGGTLVTLDRRALRTYDMVGCEAVLLGTGGHGSSS